MTCSGTLVHNLELLRDLVVSQVVTGWNRNPGKGPNLHVTHRVLMTHAILGAGSEDDHAAAAEDF